MKLYLLLCITILTTTWAYAQQNGGPTPVTPAMAAKFNAEIDKETPAFMVKLEKDNNERTDKFDESIKFGVDTFKIENFMRKSLNVDYSTMGINQATYDAATKYDALLNKYYKLLSAKLQPADRATLLTAQKSWLAFRDDEMKLYSLLRLEKYSGGGTIQSNLAASEYFDIVKQRTLQLFAYYADLYN